jgi:hypothetical protein
MLALIVVALTAVGGGSERNWTPATCKDVGVKRDMRVGAGAADSGPFVRAGGGSRGSIPEVATFVFETETLRIEAQEMHQIGPASLNIKVGDTVTVALDKKTLYVREGDKKDEYRLLVTKSTSKPRE